MNLWTKRLARCLALAGCVLGFPVGAVAEHSVDERAWQLDAVYTGEIWRNTRGGLERGNAYLDNFDLTLAVDGERALGVKGLQLFAYGLYNNGNEITGNRVGDIQAVSSIESVRAVRLYELWADLRLGGGETSVRVGLYDLNSEFDVTETAGLFAHASHGMGAEFALSGLNGPSIFPVTSLAARLLVKPSDRYAFQLAVLDGVPGDPDDPDRTTIRLGDGDGALVVGEAQYFGERVRKAAIGHWRYTGKFDDLVAVDQNDDPIRRSGTEGTYALADFSLWRASPGAEQGLDGWVRFGLADDDVNPLASFLGFGVVYTGILPTRAADKLGLGVARVINGTPIRTAATLAGGRLERQETNIELTYRFAVNDWLTLQPDVQYIVNPGTDPTLDNALVIGVRFELAYGL